LSIEPFKQLCSFHIIIELNFAYCYNVHQYRQQEITILRVCFRINLSGGMQNVLGRIAATLVILCPVIVFSIPESAIQASSIKSSQTEQVKKYYFESIRINYNNIYLLN